ncbi:MAG TPA: 2-phosphosulfolactate phosphatase [Chthonomonadaceae bacterium]|nr:2-phosphosulfolactate phosphatase [Chthonomonadaceae bacterium]
MQIRVALLPQLAGDVSGAVCVVVDVLRATTVIATLFERHCPHVCVAASHETARTYARAQGYVLCGETGGYRVPDFDYGNSPVEFSTLDFAGRPVVLSTTNGTKATAAVADARRVFLGAAVNRKAVAEAAWTEARETGSDIVVVCSGTDDQFTLEDATVAGLYVEGITAQAGAWEMPEVADSAIACRRLWEGEPNLLRGWMEGIHARTLADRGFGADVGYCSAIDTLSHVPTLVTGAELDMVSAPVVLIR